MEVLVYNDLGADKLKDKLKKVIGFLQADDFRSADVKKMIGTGYYRAKLDDTNRLLFSIGTFADKRYIFILEVILNHAYEKSRFLRGAVIDESKLLPVNSEKQITPGDTAPITYINPNKKSFHLLDKILSFDETQDEILHLPAPGIIIGSAGSGKTALTLEKAKILTGRVLYITLSGYLVENASLLYYSFDYENSKQEVEFLSFFEYLSTIDVPKGKEIDFRGFEQWISKYRQSHKIKDAYKVFEEFKGVITGSVVDKPYLSLKDYLSLGIKQSIFPEAERGQIYDLFTKYLEWLKAGVYFDSNIVSYNLLERIEPRYDYVVVDEVQDITNVQLMLILKSLHNPANFVLCGDSNQIVHPNFFSWAQIKTLFYKQDLKANIIRVLATNYRNTPEVTKIANQLLLIKNARFGSIDKESTYLVKPNSKHTGGVEFLENNAPIKADLNQKTKQSTKFAVLVLRNEDKAAAKAFFQTPLLFSIQEAKGLEYENIILYNAISGYDKEFRELTNGVTPADLDEDSLKFSRAKDKADKSLDEYKFYVNSLYVGITRAIKNLYVIETNKKHELLFLLGLTNFKQQSSVKNQASSKEEWQKEAHRLEMQGKQEQADAIRTQILKVQPVPWEVTTRGALKELFKQALNPELFNKKAKDRLFEYALYYNERGYFTQLAQLKYRPAERWEQEGKIILKRMLAEYYQDNVKALEPKLQKYGIDFPNELNLTPFMIAIAHGAEKIAGYLVQNGAKINVTDNFGRNALQQAILKAHIDASFKGKVINRFYDTLKGESTKVKIDNRLIKIDSHQAEFLMLNYMIAVLRTHLINQLDTAGLFFRLKNHKPAFQTLDFANFFDGLAHNIVPEYRRQRPYLSSILAKNEVNRDDKYNKKLFVRLETGLYLPNPLMEILIDDEWVNIYDMIDIDEIEKRQAVYGPKIISRIKNYREQLTKNPDAKIDPDKYWLDN
ncbi:UvrD-helicase domain-containing protein [Mucilaginibacter paludis]|uniref:DNA 3'-5' helicase II n=1 Tax=Mucilaginibacter paludis DSM 18603 TaxID=714943 RepID=H1YGE9_9SPHI|nr:UvrD-helicase domain-containing protein [Mucilaginibacter paludis]EHQ24501.1 Ankyrin [Mucilaginibacter paludis DSM 18603]